MSDSSNIANATSRIRVRRTDVSDAVEEGVFTDDFRLGRDAECEMQIHSGLVSRVHAEVLLHEGYWWVRDLQSTNGVYIGEEKIEEQVLEDGMAFRLGKNGPIIEVNIEQPFGHKEIEQPSAPAFDEDATVFGMSPANFSDLEATTLDGDPEQMPPASHPSPDPSPEPAPVREPKPQHAAYATPPRPFDPSESQVIRRYFDPTDDGPAGEHTMMIRQAYKSVQKKQKRKYGGVIVAVVVLLLLTAGYAVFQRVQNKKLEARASEIFYQMKEQDLSTAQLQVIAEETGNADLQRQLEVIKDRRRQLSEQYEGYIEELGVYRKLSDEEKLIFRVARIFNESEFGMPAGFVRKVRDMIQNHWTKNGRATFVQAVERAEARGYTPHIVETMQKYGLPPEFFYLAMQESVLNPDAVGPDTRWGRAKGMWQFIPSTARRYDLLPGPREHLGVVDPQDERHDFELATDAAARYLLDIYSTPAQASGLLVIASYNWGEHRVINKLEQLPGPQGIPDEALDGIPADPSKRNYWAFLNEYEDRMPEETKDYVIKIFAAAVIGQDPRRYGFDFDNPLAPYMLSEGEASTIPSALAERLINEAVE